MIELDRRMLGRKETEEEHGFGCGGLYAFKYSKVGEFILER